MSLSRQLIAFAYVADAFQKTGDITLGLLPLFAPVIASRAGAEFVPEQFARDVAEHYGIEMHPYVAEDLAPNLARSGYLEVVAKHQDSMVSYRNSSINLAELPVSEEKINTLLDDYCAYANKRLRAYGIAISDADLKAGFFDRLIKTEFINLVLKPDKSFINDSTLTLKKNGTSVEGNLNDQLLDFLSAFYIVEKYSSAREDFDLLVSISSGALVSEVVLSLQSPPNMGDEFNGLKIVIDGPLILDALGFGQDDSVRYAKLLIEQLVALKAEIVTFQHVMDEIREAIKAPLDAFTRGYEAYGPIGRKLRKNSSFASYLRIVLGRLPEEVAKLSIRVYPFSNVDRERVRAKFTPGSEGNLSNHIGLYSNIEAKLRDARSVADVLRIRSKKEVNKISEAEIIFVTRNSRLANLSKRFLIQNGLVSEKYIPPCLTDRQMAGLIWITRGGKGADISRQRLIANCTAAVVPRRDVVTKMYKFLSELNEPMSITFEALMTNERAEYYLMNRTMGNVTLITKDNLEEIYREVELIAGERVAELKDKEINNIKDSHKREVEAISQQAQASISAAKEEIDTISKLARESISVANLAKLEAELHRDREAARAKQAEIAAQELKDGIKSREVALMRACMNEGIRTERIIIFILLMVMFIITFLFYFISSYLPDKFIEYKYLIAGIAGILQALFVILNFFAFPDRAFRKYVNKKRDEAGLSEFLCVRRFHFTRQSV